MTVASDCLILWKKTPGPNDWSVRPWWFTAEPPALYATADADLNVPLVCYFRGPRPVTDASAYLFLRYRTLLCGCGGAAGVLLWRAGRRRVPPGHCRRCGYDLRASPGVCPACGTAVVVERGRRRWNR